MLRHYPRLIKSDSPGLELCVESSSGDSISTRAETYEAALFLSLYYIDILSLSGFYITSELSVISELSLLWKEEF